MLLAPPTPLAGNIGPDWPCNVCTWFLVLAPPLALIIASWGHVALWIPISLALMTVATLLLLAWADFSDPFAPQQTPSELARQRAELAEAGYDAHTLSTCAHCSIVRELDTKHCYACDRCVHGIDRETAPRRVQPGAVHAAPSVRRALPAGGGPLERSSLVAATRSARPVVRSRRLADHCPWHGKCIGSVNLLPFYGFLWAVCGLIIVFVIAIFVWFTSPMF